MRQLHVKRIDAREEDGNCVVYDLDALDEGVKNIIVIRPSPDVEPEDLRHQIEALANNANMVIALPEGYAFEVYEIEP